jgi:glycosyltransferase involved in cell wall biosynthesis
VVVPCHNNSWQLGGILKSLHYQTVSVEKVVVVDDNSNSREEDRLRSLAKELGARYRKLPPPRNRRETLGRRSHARNVGTKSLDTDIILYLDGDMLLGPRYVEGIKHYHATLQSVYIRGNRYGIPAALQVKGMEVCLNQVAKQHISTETLPSTYIIRPADFIGTPAYKAAYYDKWQRCASNNLSVRNEHASRIGYLDENFLGWGEEDMDFSFRLYQLGLTPLLLASDRQCCCLPS